MLNIAHFQQLVVGRPFVCQWWNVEVVASMKRADEHARSHGPAASRSDNFTTSSNHDQQERAPDFCENAPPLKGVVQEVGRQLPLGDSLPLRYVCLVSKRFHFSGSRPKGVVQWWASTFSYMKRSLIEFHHAEGVRFASNFPERETAGRDTIRMHITCVYR
jgi:hypothetical protein